MNLFMLVKEKTKEWNQLQKMVSILKQMQKHGSSKIPQLKRFTPCYYISTTYKSGIEHKKQPGWIVIDKYLTSTRK